MSIHYHDANMEYGATSLHGVSWHFYGLRQRTNLQYKQGNRINRQTAMTYEKMIVGYGTQINALNKYLIATYWSRQSHHRCVFHFSMQRAEPSVSAEEKICYSVLD